MTRTIRRTIVVEYESAYSMLDEKLCRLEPMDEDGELNKWAANWPSDAQIRETVEEITEDAGKPPAGVGMEG